MDRPPMIDDPVEIWLLLTFPLRGKHVTLLSFNNGRRLCRTQTVMLVQAIALTVVMVFSASGPRTSYTAKPRCPGSYAEL